MPETTAVQETMRDMIVQEGAKSLFPTSFGYFDPHILKVAKEFPKVQFLHCGGLYTPGKHPANVGSYFGYIDEAEYISGIVAGHMTKSNKLGFIAAKPIPQVLRNINSLHARRAQRNPKATVQVIFTGDWSMPVKEAEAATSLIDQGVDVLTCHVDSPKVIVRPRRSAALCPRATMRTSLALAPKGYLTGAEWNWSNVYSNMRRYPGRKDPLTAVIPHLSAAASRRDLQGLALWPAGQDKAKKDAEAAKAKFMDGAMVIYKGEIKDNTGKVVIPAGTELKQQDIYLGEDGVDRRRGHRQARWLVASCFGSPTRP